MGWKDPNKKKEYTKRYYQEHKEEISEQNRQYQKNMPLEVRAKQRQYQHKWYLRNKDKCKSRSHDHWQINKKELNRTRNEFRRKLREQAIELLGGKCANPYNLNHGDFSSDFRCLQIDHVNGGGTKEARHIGSRKICHIIVTRPKEEWQNKYQLLCANCNWIKAYENEIRRVY